mmetsp:Transcript_24971/g.59354  ORF Transcript_24971/g.59354 Transcript_24971/m.59354 type:complete len:466 (-) Transcript_24971:2338-3735(-)
MQLGGVASTVVSDDLQARPLVAEVKVAGQRQTQREGRRHRGGPVIGVGDEATGQRHQEALVVGRHHTAVIGAQIARETPNMHVHRGVQIALRNMCRHMHDVGPHLCHRLHGGANAPAPGEELLAVREEIDVHSAVLQVRLGRHEAFRRWASRGNACVLHEGGEHVHFHTDSIRRRWELGLPMGRRDPHLAHRKDGPRDPHGAQLVLEALVVGGAAVHAKPPTHDVGTVADVVRPRFAHTGDEPGGCPKVRQNGIGLNGLGRQGGGPVRVLPPVDHAAAVIRAARGARLQKDHPIQIAELSPPGCHVTGLALVAAQLRTKLGAPHEELTCRLVEVDPVLTHAVRRAGAAAIAQAEAPGAHGAAELEGPALKAFVGGGSKGADKDPVAGAGVELRPIHAEAHGLPRLRAIVHGIHQHQGILLIQAGATETQLARPPQVALVVVISALKAHHCHLPGLLKEVLVAGRA